MSGATGGAAADLTSASVLTCTGRGLLELTCRATWSKFCTAPRGTPKPAEPGVIFSDFGMPEPENAVRPRPTMTVLWPLVGGTGTIVLVGGFTTRGTKVQVFQYPGTQNHP